MGDHTAIVHTTTTTSSDGDIDTSSSGNNPGAASSSSSSPSTPARRGPGESGSRGGPAGPSRGDEEVRAFVAQHGLASKAGVFVKAAALLAAADADADDDNADDDDDYLALIPHLTAAETEALVLETEHKWSQPAMLYFTIAVCSIGAIEQGWAQSSMNGANLYYPAEFGIGSSAWGDTLVVGLINSAIYLSTGVV